MGRQRKGEVEFENPAQEATVFAEEPSATLSRASESAPRPATSSKIDDTFVAGGLRRTPKKPATFEEVSSPQAGSGGGGWCMCLQANRKKDRR